MPSEVRYTTTVPKKGVGLILLHDCGGAVMKKIPAIFPDARLTRSPRESALAINSFQKINTDLA